MKKKTKKQLEGNLSEMLKATLSLLEDLHVVHKKTEIEKLLAINVPGLEITVAKLINNLFNILSPVVDIARRQYPALFLVIDWAEEIVRKLIKG